jgi:hypothetical protein
MQFQNQGYGLQFPPLAVPPGGAYGSNHLQDLGVERTHFTAQMNPASSAPAQKYTVFVSNLSYDTAWQVLPLRHVQWFSCRGFSADERRILLRPSLCRQPT